MAKTDKVEGNFLSKRVVFYGVPCTAGYPVTNLTSGDSTVVYKPGKCVRLNGTDGYFKILNPPEFNITDYWCVRFRARLRVDQQSIITNCMDGTYGYRVTRLADGRIRWLMKDAGGNTTYIDIDSDELTWEVDDVLDFIAYYTGAPPDTYPSVNFIFMKGDGTSGIAYASNTSQTNCTLNGTIPDVLQPALSKDHFFGSYDGASYFLGADIHFILCTSNDNLTTLHRDITDVYRDGVWDGFCIQATSGALADEGDGGYTVTGYNLDSSNIVDWNCLWVYMLAQPNRPGTEVRLQGNNFTENADIKLYWYALFPEDPSGLLELAVLSERGDPAVLTWTETQPWWVEHLLFVDDPDNTEGIELGEVEYIGEAAPYVPDEHYLYQPENYANSVFSADFTVISEGLWKLGFSPGITPYGFFGGDAVNVFRKENE